MNCFIPSLRACGPVLFFLISYPALSQNSFHKILGSTKYEFANTILPISGGYILAGRVASTDTTGACLLKIDPDGAVLWQKAYGKISGGEEFYSVAQADDKGFVALGFSQSFDFNNDIYLIKTDSAGNPQWQKIITSIMSNTSDYGYKVVPVAGGSIGTGLTANKTLNGAPVLFRIDNDGETIWSKYYTTGSKSSFRLYDAFLSGDTLFACGFKDSIATICLFNAADGSPLGGVLLDDPGFTAMKELRFLAPASNGDLLLAGYVISTDTFSSHRQNQWVCRMSRYGEVRWSKTYSGVGWGAITPMADGNFLLSPSIDFINFEHTPYLVKIDSTGELIWASQYSKPGADLFASALETPGGDIFAVGYAPQPSGSFPINMLVVKTNKAGHIAGCCQRPASVNVMPYPVVMTPLNLIAQPFYNTKNVTLPVYDRHPVDVSFCPPLPPTVRNVTVDLCPGDSIVIDGTAYTGPGSVSSTLHGPECDTLVQYTLLAGVNPVLEKTIAFCPGDTVTIAGVGYTAPASVQVTLPSASGHCDTLLTCFLVYAAPAGPTTLTVQCPPDVLVQVPAGTAATPATYGLPTAQSDCPCPGIRWSQSSGLPSGSAFPSGITPVCFQARDSCGNAAECCFEVRVEETDAACDSKKAGCVQFDLLRITRDVQGRRSYYVRVANHCTQALAYAAFQLPDGIVAEAPLHSYTSPDGRTYAVRNPNYAPVYSIRFAPLGAGIPGGASDLFRFTLPPQSAPDYLNVLAKLAGQPYVEAHLNTFNCPVLPEPAVSKPGAGRSSTAAGGYPAALHLFPNPAHDVLYADLRAWAGQTLYLRVFNARGQLAHETSIFAGEESLRLDLPAGMPAGLYLFEVIPAQGGRIVSRMVLR